MDFGISLEVNFPKGLFFFFFCLLTNLLPKNVSIHRKQLAEKKKLYYLISQQFIEEETR